MKKLVRACSPVDASGHWGTGLVNIYVFFDGCCHLLGLEQGHNFLLFALLRRINSFILLH